MAFVLGSGLTGADWDFGHEGASIVGLWRFKFLSEGNLTSAGIPDGAVLDQGYSAWHSDGTEIMNSGRDPLTGSFCLGAWKQTGRSSFKLSHYAMNWSGLTVDAKGNVILDPKTKQPLNVLIGPSNISENVTVDGDRDSFQGTFTIENYDPLGKVLIRLTGKVTAVRLTADSPGFVQ
ncbi:hypothetical protein RBB79_13020 [Tunturiibacter empetritectus]|uniref:Rhodanese domain-containing protein n=2 Tax=Tunturiibacter TaxID=3154218 RepID=A0A852VMA6_9BACT|nr:hypothetical protein [Edaphobacter lichenicola]NYF90522.1 hypothetical protein [Edaphobacter lichenicola]